MAPIVNTCSNALPLGILNDFQLHSPRPDLEFSLRTPYLGARLSRAFLNLWFAKPMVCLRVAFHENDGNHENDKNDEDNSDSYKQGVECWIRGKSRKPRK